MGLPISGMYLSLFCRFHSPHHVGPLPLQRLVYIPIFWVIDFKGQVWGSGCVHDDDGILS